VLRLNMWKIKHEFSVILDTCPCMQRRINVVDVGMNGNGLISIRSNHFFNT
jgi:hypothetical protein